MSEKAKQAKNEYMKEYMKEWRQRPGNKEKIQEYKDRYWEKQVEQESYGELGEECQSSGISIVQKVIPYQLKLLDVLNSEIKVDAHRKGLTKHKWIEKAIREKLKRDAEFNETLNLLSRAYLFVKGGPATKLEEDLKVYCDHFSHEDKE